MTSTLFIHVQDVPLTETDAATESFDNSLFADLVGADVGFPVTINGDTFLERDPGGNPPHRGHYRGAYSQISSAYHENFCVTADALLTDRVKLLDDTVVSIEDYDAIVIGHYWAYNYYILYLLEQYPEKSIIGIQEESVQDVSRYSSLLSVYHRRVLDNIDGYIVENDQFEQYVRQFTDDVLRVPLHVPEGQFESVTGSNTRTGEVCLGITSWNIDFSNFYTNIAVLDRLRDDGYQLNGELLGVQDFQKRMTADYDEIEFVTTTGYVESDFYEYISQYEFGIHLTTRATSGRVSAEFAGVGVPLIGNKNNDLQQRCWPDLSIDPFDIDSAIELATRLLEDDAFYDQCVQRASETVQELQNYEETATEVNAFLNSVAN